MAETNVKLFTLNCLPGIKRDGTPYDNQHWADGQWVRFKRGKPCKMGGYREFADNLASPIRSTLVWSRQQMNAVYCFSTSEIEQVLIDENGVGASIINRTPSGFVANDNYIWSTDTMYDDAVASDKTIILAHASQSMANIDDSTDMEVYYGGATDSTAFTAIPGLAVSGGVFATAPYAVYYGSDGAVTWSNVNEPLTIDSGDAGSDRVTGSKIVKGLSVPSGAGPGGLLWSLDSVIQMDYVGGAAIFRFTTVNRKSSILAQNSVIEYDGGYYWVGIDRFMMFDGGVKELPNQMNNDYFFDNLNYAQRQKVWAMKVPRYGEIWWFYPVGSEEECSRAVIYNVREQCWYDAVLPRSSGFYSQVFKFPVMTSSTPIDCVKFDITVTSSGFFINDTITGENSNSGTILNISGTDPDYTLTVQPIGPVVFIVGEAITNQNGAEATLTSPPVDAQVTSAFVHEVGKDVITNENIGALRSYIESSDIGLTSGGPSTSDTPEVPNSWTRLRRIEPDFLLNNELIVSVTGTKYAMSDTETGGTYTFVASDGKIDTNEQFRQMRIKFMSDSVGGDYEMGRILITMGAGDNRS